MKILILLRHVSGAGSSTFARTIQHICDTGRTHCLIASTDQFFEKDGEYKFNTSLLGQAHKECFEKVDNGMFFKVPVIIVTNTFTTEKEIKPYIETAEKYGYKIFSLICENRHGNIDTHNVPVEKRQQQLQRLKGSLKLI